MTIVELLAAMTREWPNGVSFDPMSLRLLRLKVPLEEWQIEELKVEMFQLGSSGLWFTREMISDDKSLLVFGGQAQEWLMEHGCFSVERLFKDFYIFSRHITTTEDCAAFLRHLGFTVTLWGKRSHFCFMPSRIIDDYLLAISETIAGWLEAADGALPFNEIEQAIPHLSEEALACIRMHFLPEVHEAEVGGVLCWCSTESITLPEDFSEKLTILVDTLVELDEKVTAPKLAFALNLFYRIRFREEYALLDNDIFMHVCKNHYKGGNDVFSNTKITNVSANGLSVSGKRMRSSNTRFSNLGVPVGAELVFTKDNHITCTVLDDSNQVEYDRKTWSISTLANHLLGVFSGNGFRYFSYESEMLWDRRLRLKRANNNLEY